MHTVSRLLACGASTLFGLAIATTGSVVSVSAAYAQSSDCGCVVAAGTAGVVQSASGNVFVSQASGSVPAQSSMPLQAGSSVLVGPQSASVVSFGGNCTLRLPANSVFEVRPQGDQLCLAVNQQAPGQVVETMAGGASDLLVPGIIAGGIGLGAIAIAASDSDNAVSK